MSVPERRAMVERPAENLSVRRQCALLNLARSGVYRPGPVTGADDLALMRRIDELHLKWPFYGSRRMVFELNQAGHGINRKRVQRLMRVMGIEALVPRPGTSKAAPGHRIYPYLLRGVSITEPNHVWASDITYIPMALGFLYLVAIIDWASRAVLAWRLSNTMDTGFCIAALDEALARHGAPKIFNTDQGAQFTSAAFTGRLEAAGIAISMDGRGRFMDNIFIERLWRSIKYEEVVCCERHCSKYERWRCFIGDEGRPLEVGLQEQASNRHELHWSRAIVVNVDGKGGARLRQVRFKETNGSKPLMTCRNVSNDVETGTQTSVPRIKIEGSLSTAQSASGMEAA
jgi:putative transposase